MPSPDIGLQENHPIALSFARDLESVNSRGGYAVQSSSVRLSLLRLGREASRVELCKGQVSECDS